MVPPSALAEFAQPEEPPVVRIVPSGCREATSADEIVVCGGSGSPLAGPAGIDPAWERRYARRRDQRSAGVAAPSSAMEAGRCATVRCPPQPMIGIVGTRF